MIYNGLYTYRFEIFLTTQLAVLFGSLFFPADFFEFSMLPIIYLISIISGILIISKKKKILWICIILFSISAFIFGSDMIYGTRSSENILIRFSVYFLFYVIVTWNIIHQVWKSKQVSKNVMIGLMSGYISLGFIAFFLFMSIELISPGAFSGTGIMDSANFRTHSDSLLYYAFITLLTIGYGDINPVLPVAQKAAVLVGLIGQFYLVIITAVIVEKYIMQNKKDL